MLIDMAMRLGMVWMMLSMMIPLHQVNPMTPRTNLHSNDSSDNDDNYLSSGEDDNQDYNSDSSSSTSSDENDDDDPDIDQHHPVEAVPMLHDHLPQQQDHSHQPPDLQLDDQLCQDPDPPLVDDSSIGTPPHGTQDSGVQGHESNMQLELGSDAEDSNPPVTEQD